MTNCSLILVALSLIGLGFGDSPLVILSLCSLVLFFVISFSLAPFVFLFFLFLFSLFVSLSVLSVLPFVFLRFLFEYIFSYLSKKKKGQKLPVWLFIHEKKKGFQFGSSNSIITTINMNLIQLD